MIRMNSGKDYIEINNLVVFGKHGVFKEENTLGQKFLVSAKLYVDTRIAGVEDDLRQSVNYGSVCKEMDEFLREKTFQLIEAVAEHLAAYLLTKHPSIRGIELTISKPWAPIGLPLEKVSVTIQRNWHTAYISLGSNMGNKAQYLKDAIVQLGQVRGCRVIQVSDFIVTKPYGGVEQDDFLNACLKLETLMEPEELLLVLHTIESNAQRTREVHWGPRTLDLDILFYDEDIYQSEDLMIPHIDMQNRDFVLRPMNQIAPYHLHPIFQKTMMQLYEELKERSNNK